MDLFLSQLLQTSWLEWLGTVSGIVAVLLSIREKVLAWPLFITCYAVYILMSYQASLPAAMILNAVFVPISIYGWWKWATPQASSSENESDSVHITQMSWQMRLIVIAAVLLISLALGYINTLIIHGYLPYLDALATVISLAAQLMLSRKYVENWIAWILADIAFIIIWGLQGYWVTVMMFVVFTILGISGMLTWKKELHTDV